MSFTSLSKVGVKYMIWTQRKLCPGFRHLMPIAIVSCDLYPDGKGKAIWLEFAHVLAAIECFIAAGNPELYLIVSWVDNDYFCLVIFVEI